MPRSPHSLSIRNNLHKTSLGIVFYFIGILIIAPFFHLHEHENHKFLCSKTYHSHSLPFNTSEQKHSETEKSHADDNQFLEIIPIPNRQQSFDLDNQIYQADIFICINPKTNLLHIHKSVNQYKHHHDNILSPQWNNYILYAASLSPPVA